MTNNPKGTNPVSIKFFAAQEGSHLLSHLPKESWCFPEASVAGSIVRLAYFSFLFIKTAVTLISSKISFLCSKGLMVMKQLMLLTRKLNSLEKLFQANIRILNSCFSNF